MADGDRFILEEYPVPGKPLGRHVFHDPRSRNFRAMSLVPRGATLVSKTWWRRLPPLDQGQLGSCTGNATAGLCMTSPNRLTGVTLTEADAVSIYSQATRIDPFPGAYPPSDTGSYGLAAMKAAVQMRLLQGYKWAFGFNEALQVLSSVGPVIVGTNWYEGMDTPSSTGYVKVSGQVRGGHEYEVLGVNVTSKYVTAINSWGPNYGLNGRFKIRFADFERLLAEDGDVACAAPTPQSGT